MKIHEMMLNPLLCLRGVGITGGRKVAARQPRTLRHREADQLVRTVEIMLLLLADEWTGGRDSL